MNTISLSGNICKDIELRQTPNGKSVIVNTIAVSRDMKDKDGNYITDFFDFVCWEAKATYLNNYASKGDRVELTGRMQQRTYVTKDGQNRTIYEVFVENIRVFPKSSKMPNNEPKEENKINITDDDLPF